MASDDSLIDFVSAVSGDEYLKVEEDLGDGFVRLRTSEAERRQAKHDIRSVEDVVIELLRNSRDAHARRIFVSSWRDGDDRTIVVLDDGVGVPDHLRDRVFDPRVTSKLETMSTDRWGVHGRGMALFSIRQSVDRARIVATAEHRGTSIEIVSSAERLEERSDQSTWPAVELDEDGAPAVVRGPHNIIRRVVEFACDHPDVDVFFGTPTDILATTHARARDTLDATELAFIDDDRKLLLWQRPFAAADARGLCEAATAMGLPVSERTAHRIMAGEIDDLAPVLAGLVPEEAPAEAAGPDIYRDRRGIRIHHTDLEDFKRDLLGAFDTLADRYYLSVKGEPKITIGRDEIRVRFRVDKED